MPRLSMQIPHTLGREEATRRIKEQLSKARDYVTVVDEQWNDYTLTFRFQVMGFKVGGDLVVEDTMVNVEVDLPLMAMVAKDKIQQRVRQEIGGLLT